MNIMTAYDNPEEHSGPIMRGMPAYWGGSKTANFPVGTVAIDRDGDAWQRAHSGIWELAGGSDDLRETLSPRWAPYTIIYTPKEKS